MIISIKKPLLPYYRGSSSLSAQSQYGVTDSVVAKKFFCLRVREVIRFPTQSAALIRRCVSRRSETLKYHPPKPLPHTLNQRTVIVLLPLRRAEFDMDANGESHAFGKGSRFDGRKRRLCNILAIHALNSLFFRETQYPYRNRWTKRPLCHADFIRSQRNDAA